MKLKKKVRDELGKAIIDIAKYVITAVVVSSFFKSFNDTWIVYILGLLTAGVMFAIGFWLLNSGEDE